MSEKFPIADAHCDFLYGMYQSDYDIKSPAKKQTVSLPYMKKGGVKLQFFAVWLDKVLKASYLTQCLTMIDDYHRMLEENSDALAPLTRSYSLTDNKIATVLTVEGGEAIHDLSILRILKRLGVSAISLTWNHNNSLADASVKRGARGLSGYGKEVALEMQERKIALDVAHLSDAGIDDALKLLKMPIFASHSNARALCENPRCLKDEHIREIARRGGVIGVNFYYRQLCGPYEAEISDIVRHILHIIEIGGIDCCAIGSDFDGMSQYPSDLQNCSHLQRLPKALLAAGLSHDDVFRVCYSNLFSFIIQFIEE